LDVTPHGASGFSLLELMASVAIVGLLMSAVFTFLAQSQKRFQGDVVIAESNQSARAALEVMAQEIGQAGANPNFNTNKIFAAPSTTPNSQPVASATAQVVTLNDICQILPGDWVGVDSGQNYEMVQVTATNPKSGTNCAYPKTVGGTITAVFQQDHCQTGSTGCTVPEPTTGAVPPWPPVITSLKQAYPTGILQGTGTSDDKTLEFFGDINADGVLNYVVYSLYCPAGAQTVTISSTTYTLCKLERSITPVTFAAATNNQASPMVQNVLYNTGNKQGPTLQPILSYTTVQIGVAPTVFTVVGTVVITLSVAVNPQALESGIVQYYTMATQVRPINLAAAVAVNSAGGVTFLPSQPTGLPMSNPANYYQ
jgi:prepilin-type N-terminal cleavage/methylation domain-containing protein